VFKVIGKHHGNKVCTYLFKGAISSSGTLDVSRIFTDSVTDLMEENVEKIPPFKKRRNMLVSLICVDNRGQWDTHGISFAFEIIEKNLFDATMFCSKLRVFWSGPSGGIESFNFSRPVNNMGQN